MSDLHPFFTIIMPVFNGENFISEAINSVLNQSYSDWELIIVDDGSTDNSISIIKNINDVRIHLIQIKHTGSAYIARKHGYSEARGQYIQMLDCDDTLNENCLLLHYNRIKETNADCVLPDLTYVNEKKELLNKWLPPKGDYSLILTGMEAFEFSLDWKIHGVACIKTDIINKCILDSNLMNADELFSKIIFSKCNEVAFDKGEYIYVRNTNSTTVSSKNIVRRYETINYWFSLYTYSIQSNFNFTLICKIAKLYFGTLSNNIYTFKKERKTYIVDDANSIIEILKINFNNLYNIDLSYFNKKQKLMLLLSHKNYYIFRFYCRVMCFLKKLKK